ncbi:MAG TPA: EthD family reductase [Chitinophagaceae bacterium]|nr:EthD family reductase [Chitinophagaceae bacterium]HRF18433.1 EthD family reductase [Chitinophagaceae bacterium]
MIKATLLYGHPTDPEAFEKYYAETHLPLAAKMQGVNRLELTKFISAPDGSKAAYYRQADLFFSSPGQLQQTMSSPEGLAAAADLANFATGGVTMIIGTVENSF